MNIYIIEGSNAGPVNGRLAKAELVLAANSLNLNIVDSAASAEVTVVIGSGEVSDKTVIGKKVYIVSDLNDIFADPNQVLTDAQSKASIFEQSTQINTSSVSDSGVKRIVAVTACPTGVAHTFMAAEAIEEEAKKRGWWCKVETRGSVGVGNELTPEEVASAVAKPPKCQVVSTVGAGDSMVGGLMYGLMTNQSIKDTLVFASSVAALSVGQAGVGIADRQAVTNMLDKIEIIAG